jgi:exosortase B
VACGDAVAGGSAVTAGLVSTEKLRSKASRREWRWRPQFDPVPALLVGAGFVLLFLPLYWNLASGTPADGIQGHEPAIFAVSALLLYRKRHELVALPSAGTTVWGGLALAIGLVLYVFGRAYDLRISLASLIVVMAAVLLQFRGIAALRVGWFALLFPLFALPLPFELVLAATGPLKIGVSEVATRLLSWAGYPVANSGVVMTVGQYQLLVTEACAGLQTMFTLEAMGLLYASLVNHPSAVRNVLLALLIVPIAFAANVMRVVALAVITYRYGDAAGQGFMHGLSGVVTFAAALLLIIATDGLLGLVWKSEKR